MAAKKVGDLIREARTAAGLTQAGLAKAAGVTASDISKAERGEKELTQAALKAIAKATGVTQASLLNAPKGASGAKTGSGGKTSSASGKTGSGKTSAKASGELKLTTSEKKLVELYRAADSDTKKAAVSVLKGEKAEGGILGSLFSSAVDSLIGGKK